MNRLKNTRCYLSGPMENDPQLGSEWRERIKKELEDLEIIWLDPVKKLTLIGAEDEKTKQLIQDAKRVGDWETVSSVVKVIRCVDLRMVDISDFIIVHLDNNIITTGTYEELFLANRQKKPVIVHHQQGKHVCSAWLFGTIPHQMIFSTWEEINNYLRYVASSENVKHFKRWIFFNFDKIETNKKLKDFDLCST